MVIVLPAANGTLLTGVFAILSKGESQVEFTIDIVDDDIPETREEFRVTLLPEIYILGERSAGQIYIEDDDGEWSVQCCSQLMRNQHFPLHGM